MHDYLATRFFRDPPAPTLHSSKWRRCCLPCFSPPLTAGWVRPPPALRRDGTLLLEPRERSREERAGVPGRGKAPRGRGREPRAGRRSRGGKWAEFRVTVDGGGAESGGRRAVSAAQ